MQDTLCTEPKNNPADALQMAVASEDGINRQKTYGYINQETKIKEEPICSVSGSSQNNRKCWRCGAGNFTLDHLKLCKGPNAICTYCVRKGHLERACNQKKKNNFQESGRFKTNGNREQSGRRVQLVDREEEEEDDENFMILNIDIEEENVFNGRLYKWKQVQGDD